MTEHDTARRPPGRSTSATSSVGCSGIYGVILTLMGLFGDTEEDEDRRASTPTSGPAWRCSSVGGDLPRLVRGCGRSWCPTTSTRHGRARRRSLTGAGPVRACPSRCRGRRRRSRRRCGRGRGSAGSRRARPPQRDRDGHGQPVGRADGRARRSSSAAGRAATRRAPACGTPSCRARRTRRPIGLRARTVRTPGSPQRSRSAASARSAGPASLASTTTSTSSANSGAGPRPAAQSQELPGRRSGRVARHAEGVGRARRSRWSRCRRRSNRAPGRRVAVRPPSPPPRRHGSGAARPRSPRSVSERSRRGGVVPEERRDLVVVEDRARRRSRGRHGCSGRAPTTATAAAATTGQRAPRSGRTIASPGGGGTVSPASPTARGRTSGRGRRGRRAPRPPGRRLASTSSSRAAALVRGQVGVEREDRDRSPVGVHGGEASAYAETGLVAVGQSCAPRGATPLDQRGQDESGRGRPSARSVRPRCSRTSRTRWARRSPRHRAARRPGPATSGAPRRTPGSPCPLPSSVHGTTAVGRGPSVRGRRASSTR